MPGWASWTNSSQQFFWIRHCGAKSLAFGIPLPVQKVCLLSFKPPFVKWLMTQWTCWQQRGRLAKIKFKGKRKEKFKSRKVRTKTLWSYLHLPFIIIFKQFIVENFVHTQSWQINLVNSCVLYLPLGPSQLQLPHLMKGNQNSGKPWVWFLGLFRSCHFWPNAITLLFFLFQKLVCTKHCV